jgi:hypothetical protein
MEPKDSAQRGAKNTLVKQKNGVKCSHNNQSTTYMGWDSGEVMIMICGGGKNGSNDTSETPHAIRNQM